MKKLLMLIICSLLVGSVLSQEKYSIPERTGDQKHGRTLYQLWSLNAASINFAKSKGVTPYEFGKYLGSLFAPGWGPGNDFDGFVKGVIYNTENCRHVKDAPLSVKVNEDGSVKLFCSDKMFHKYFPDDNPFVSYKDFLEFYNGIFEPIANHMGASVNMEIKDTLMIFTLKKK